MVHRVNPGKQLLAILQIIAGNGRICLLDVVALAAYSESCAK